MRVVSVDVIPLTLPFRLSFGHSLASRSHSTNVFVRVRLADGSEGFGEGVPRDYVTGESTDDAIDRIRRVFAPVLMATELAPLPGLLKQLEQLTNCFELGSKRWGASWCALELAILDAVARSQQRSLADLLGPCRRESIRYGAVVPFSGKKALKALLYFYKLYGFQTVKLKVGDDIESDAARLALARKILGAGVTLRVDANCGWTVETAKRAADRFSAFGISSYEQPLAADDLSGMARLTAALQAQVVADESLCTLDDARRLVATKACSGFNIRISKVGGLLAARRMAQLARAAGIKCHLGAQVGESGILSAAGRLFACLEEPFENYEGSANLLLLKQDLTRENLTAGWGGHGRLLRRPGLGVTVVPERFSKSQWIEASGGVEAPKQVSADSKQAAHP